MKDTNLNLILHEVSMAGVPPRERERTEHIEKRRITSTMDIPEQEYLFRLHGTPCFPLGELVALTGKQKSGKTFFASILISLCLRQSVMGMERIRGTGLRVMWIDTEQSRQSTQKILRKRILPMVRPTPSLPVMEGELDVFNLRADNWDERLELAEVAIRRHRPELVVFDGIRDCTNDINDQVLSESVISRLTKLASGYRRQDGDAVTISEWPPCCIVCVLHENKSPEDDTLRGALGTELGNKAFEVFECKQDRDNGIFTASQTNTREYTIHEPLTYTVGADGLPYLLDNGEPSIPEVSPTEKNVMSNVFQCIIPVGGEIRAGILRERLDALLGMNSNRRRDKFIDDAIALRIISKHKVGFHAVFYSLGPEIAPLNNPPAVNAEEQNFPF